MIFTSAPFFRRRLPVQSERVEFNHINGVFMDYDFPPSAESSRVSTLEDGPGERSNDIPMWRQFSQRMPGRILNNPVVAFVF